MSAHPAGLEHRRLLGYPPGIGPFRGAEISERIGGQLSVDRLVDLLYDGIAGDGELRPLFPRDLAHSRSMSKLFFAEWLGGPRHYSEQSHAGMRQRHGDLPITPALADRWLGHFRRAMEDVVETEADRGVIVAQVRSLALTLVNEPVAPVRFPRPGTRAARKAGRDSGSRDGPWPVAWCGIGARSVARARDLGHRGDVAGLGAALAEAPDLLLASFAAAIMQSAALAGRVDTVRLLLGAGVDADRPAAPRLTGWTRPPRRYRGPRSGT